ncbi:MAG: M23 family metallopeptidase [Candidatus Neomarinimicrobiota bacterium]
MKILRRFLAGFFCTASFLFPQEYTWPVDLGRAISSNFGEVRPRRFHAGIDVKTEGTTGHEVRAADDGYVWRIKVSSSGYGRVLYLKLDDGHTAVYAHLDKFFPLLNDIVKIEQERQNSFTIEKYFAPGELPVKKGDLIGYSGESGHAFGPHLHFELRDSAQHPLNPLTSGFSVPDRRKPVAEALAVVPLSRDAVVNGSPLPQIFPLRVTQTGEYEFPDTIHVFGTVGLEISASDKITGFPGVFNIHGAALSIDGIEQYRIEFLKFDFPQSHLVEIERDNSFRRLNDGEFHRLFVLAHSDQLEFIRENSRGQLKLAPGHHRVSIRVFDHSKNVSRITGTLYYAPPIRIKATVLGETSRALTVKVQPDGSPFPVTDLVCYSFNEKGYVERKVEPISIRPDAVGLVVDLPRTETRNRILQFIGVDRFGAVSHPFHIPAGIRQTTSTDAQIDFSTTHLEKSVILQVESRSYLSDPPEVVLRTSASERLLNMVQIRPTTFLSTPLSPQQLDNVRDVVVSIHGSPTREIRFQFRPRLSTLHGSAAVISPDGRCSLQALPTTFYDTTAFWIERVVQPVPVDGGQIMSDTYQLQPFDRPLMDSARVALTLSRSIEEPAHMGIFYYDQKRGWTYLPSRFSDKKRMFYCSVYSLEAVAILQDTVKPIIRDIFPGHGGKYDFQDVKRVSARIEDKLAGIKGEGSIKMHLDGRRLLFEYMPVKKSVRYPLDEPLESGKHTLSVTAVDQVGNLSSKTVEFFVN